MSITLITGVPGSGKTLYTISKLLQPLIGATIKRDVNGTQVEQPRVLFTNINGLLLDHEMIDGGDNLGLRDWHKWAKPGAIICFDEFQKSWPPRANGSKIPDDIQALDTHRHMGVDFILVTQNCMNVDRHILGLVDRHLHIRRVANMPMSVVYEWDHASKSLLFKNAITKSPWRYDKSVYKLYKSAEVHTKQKRKIPTLVWFVLFGIVGAGYLMPTFYGRITERISPTKTASSPVADSANGSKTYFKDGMSYTVDKTVFDVNDNPAPAMPTEPQKPKIAGCIRTASRCGCFDPQGEQIDVEKALCESKSPTGGKIVNIGPDTPISPRSLVAFDIGTL